MKTFIDGAEHGVILFSIGSFVQSYNMPSEMLAALRKTFAQIPQRVIWKAEKRIEGLSENVLVSKWLPQRDILGKLKKMLLYNKLAEVRVCHTNHKLKEVEKLIRRDWE